MTRTLPVRVQPAAGESLTSWLCAYAHRNQVTWEQMLTAVGLHRRRGDMKRLGWVARLHPHEIDTLGTATGLDAATLSDMTLARFDALGITTGRRPTRPDFGALRGPARPQRYCARCLAETGGRWQLQWSLGWTFACLDHGCLLADKCPQCLRRPQRASPFARVVPDLSTCGQPHQGGIHTLVCGTDLRQAADAVPMTTAETLEAQRIIDQVIDGCAKGFAIYGERSVTPAHVLADLRALAGRIVTRPTDRDIRETADDQSATDPSPMANDGSPTIHDETRCVAVGFTAAVDIMAAPDLDASVRRTRHHLAGAPVERSSSDLAHSVVTGRGTTPVVAAVQLIACGPRLDAVDQLRFRVGTDQPHHPSRPEARLAKITRALPTLLWPECAAGIVSGEGDDPVVRAALSCALAHVGTEASAKTVALLLGNDFDASLMWSTLQRLTSGPHRLRVLRRVTQLADDLAANPVLIDYHRRRRLDYSALLPEDDWALIERNAGDQPAAVDGLTAARCVLFEQLSGLPMWRAPWVVHTPGFRCVCADVVGTLSSVGAKALACSGADFLASQGITDEPLTVPRLPAPIDDTSGALSTDGVRAR